jgi:hypothetical protein
MVSSVAPGVPAGEIVEALADQGEEAPRLSSAPPPRVALEEILPTPAVPEPRPQAPAIPGMRSARVTRLRGRQATIAFRGREEGTPALVAPEVDAAVIADAVESGDSVLVEVAEGETPLIVGVLHTRRPSKLKLRAATVEIEGEEEILIRSGRGALRVRADGDIEVVGSRISAASRGLFRIVGRMLRLN